MNQLTSIYWSKYAQESQCRKACANHMASRAGDATMWAMAIQSVSRRSRRAQSSAYIVDVEASPSQDVHANWEQGSWDLCRQKTWQRVLSLGKQEILKILENLEIFGKFWKHFSNSRILKSWRHFQNSDKFSRKTVASWQKATFQKKNFLKRSQKNLPA